MGKTKNARVEAHNDERGGVLFRLLAWLVIIAVIIAGGIFWYVKRNPSISVSNAISSCSLNLVVANPYYNGALHYVAVGTGATSAIAAIRGPDGWISCVDADGVSTANIPDNQLNPALSVLATVIDGSPKSGLLILVHHDEATTYVTASVGHENSTVQASAQGFEVLHVPVSHWPVSRADATTPIHVGTLSALASDGHVTARQPLEYCANSKPLRLDQSC